MIFQSKIRRQWIRKMILAVLADALLTACITTLATVYDPGYAHWAVIFVVVFLALQVLGITSRIIYGVINWIAFYLYDRNSLKDVFLSMLRMVKLPCPDEFENSPEQYIANVADNSGCAIDVRLGAAHLCGQIAAIEQMNGWCANVRLAMALEDAVTAHRESCTRSASA